MSVIYITLNYMLNNNIWVKYSGIYILLSIYYMSVSEEVTKMRI